MLRPCLIWLLTLLAAPSFAQVFKTQAEALKDAFPGGATVTRKSLFLTDQQVARIQASARTKVESKLVTYYVGTRSDSVLGYAFFETNVVRTKPETFMVVVAPDSTVQRVEMLAFYEPFDYLPTPKWFRLFERKKLNPDLWPKRGIDGISGATLTVRSVVQGVRKVLAVYQVAVPKEKQ